MRLALLVTALALPALAHAQLPSRADMVHDWEHARQRTVAFLDAAPDSMLGYRTTPGVRTFGEQINHVAQAAAQLYAMTVEGKKQPPAVLAGDSAVYLHNKAALRARVNAAFDYIVASAKNLSDADLAATTTALGVTQAHYRWHVMLLDHSAFTLGQTVPYLRMNNVTPPTYLPF